ncbi:hypothetical protein [Desulfomarina sp.]
MKLKLFIIISVMLFLLPAGGSQAAMTLKVIGRSPFYQPPLTSVEELRSMVQTRAADVRDGFNLTSQGSLYSAFMEQIMTVPIKKAEFSRGTKLDWMLFKKKGKGRVRVVRDVTWGGEKPFPGYTFFIDNKGRRYTFVVPAGCGNIALAGTALLPKTAAVVSEPPERKVEPPVNQAPRCTMTVAPVKAFCGQRIRIDATDSEDKDGTIERMEITFTDEQGTVVSRQTLNGLQGDALVPCGVNTLHATLFDDKTSQSATDQCNVTVTGISRFGFLADAGYFRQYDPANHLFARVGLEYRITEDFSLLGMVGGAPHIHGLDGKSAVLVDGLGEYHWSNYFVNLGVGGWLTDGDSDNDAENSQLDLIASAGARVYGEPDAFNASLFIEVRSGVDEIGDLIDYGRFGFGVRFRF